MAKAPSEVLKKSKKADKDHDRDDKKGSKDGMLAFIAKHKKGGDVGKHNNGKTTGFKAVEKNAAKEYGSKEAGEKVAGAVYQKMRKKHEL